MKLYNSIGPNPHIVRMFLAERGVEVPMEEVDLIAGDNRREPFLSVNPAGQLPALVLDNGQVVSEVVAICEYIDEVSPGPRLIGDTAEERAQVRRWSRWVDLNVMEPMFNGFRFGEGMAIFENRIRTIPEASAGLKACVQDKLEWLDAQLSSRPFVAGERFSLADVLLFCALTFGNQVGQPLRPELAHLNAWFDKIGERASAKA